MEIIEDHENIKNNLKRLQLVNSDLKIEIEMIISQISKYNDLGYGDIEDLRKLTRILNELMDKYSNNETTINMIVWTIKEIKNNDNKYKNTI